MSKDTSEKAHELAQHPDAAVVQDGGVLSMHGFGVTIIRFSYHRGFFCCSGKSRRDGGSNLF